MAERISPKSFSHRHLRRIQPKFGTMEASSWGSDENKNGTASTCYFTILMMQTEHARPNPFSTGASPVGEVEE